MPIVKMPDGQLVDMPDKLSQEELDSLQAITANIEVSKNPETGRTRVSPGMEVVNATVDQIAKVGKDLPGITDQAGRGVLTLSGLGGDLTALGANYLGKKFEAPPTINPLFKMMPSEALNDITTGALEVLSLGQYARPDKPESELGKAIGNIAETMTAGGIAKGAMPVKKALQIAAGSGIGAEAAARVDPENPLWRLFGGLAGGGATLLGQNLLPNKVNIAKEIMADVDPATFNRAVSTQQGMREVGRDINLSQAMDSPSNIDSATALMANVKEGKKVTDQLRSQPNALELETGLQQSKLPGVIDARQNISNRIQEAATGVIKQLKKVRSALSDKYYKQIGAVPESVSKGLVIKIDNYLKTPGLMDDTKSSLADLRGRLVTQQQIPGSTILGPNGQPITPAKTVNKYLTNALDIKAAIKNTVGERASWVLNPKDPETMGQIKYATKMLFDDLGNQVLPLKRANAAYRQFTLTRVDPMKKSILGKLAQPRGAQSDINAAENSIFSLFDKGTQSGQKTSPIRTAAHELNKQDPSIFRDAGKTWFSEKLSKIQANKIGDRPPEQIAQELIEVFGNPNPSQTGVTSATWQTTQDILDGMGLNPTQIKGFKSVLDFAVKASIRPNKVGGLTAQGANAVANESILNRFGNVNFMTPFRQPALALARVLHSKVLSNVDDWLSTPEGAKLLQELGKQTPGNSAWQNALMGLSVLGTEVRQTESDQINQQ